LTLQATGAIAGTSLLRVNTLQRFAVYPMLVDVSALIVSTIHKANIAPVLAGDSTLNIRAVLVPIYSDVAVINGWYVDSKGGIHYYYRTPDGRPVPQR
jgi:hypothetical protein